MVPGEGVSADINTLSFSCNLILSLKQYSRSCNTGCVELAEHGSYPVQAALSRFPAAIERVFEARSCRLVAAAVGCRFQIVCTKVQIAEFWHQVEVKIGPGDASGAFLIPGLVMKP